MDKFVYSENEIKFARTQCGLCIYQNEKSETSCQKFVQKPEGVLEGKRKCPCLKTVNILDI